jgi:putative flippase GtrA
MSRRGLARFPLVYVFQYALTATLLWPLVDILRIGERIALVAAIVVTVPVTFVAARLAILPGRRQ